MVVTDRDVELEEGPLGTEDRLITAVSFVVLHLSAHFAAETKLCSSAAGSKAATGLQHLVISGKKAQNDIQKARLFVHEPRTELKLLF